MRIKCGGAHIQPAVIVFLVVIVDQITKALVINGLALYSRIPVINGFFNLTHIHNPGGAFGLMANQGVTIRVFFFLVVSFAAMVFVFYSY